MRQLTGDKHQAERAIEKVHRISPHGVACEGLLGHAVQHPGPLRSGHPAGSCPGSQEREQARALTHRQHMGPCTAALHSAQASEGPAVAMHTLIP